MANSFTKYEVSRCTRYEAINGGAKCRKWGGLGRLGGTEAHGQCHHSIKRIRLPIQRNAASISYRFRDIAGYLSKVADLLLAPRLGVTPVEFRSDLRRQNTRLAVLSSGVVCVSRDHMFSCFSRTPTWYRQTDRHGAIAHTVLA